ATAAAIWGSAARTRHSERDRGREPTLVPDLSWKAMVGDLARGFGRASGSVSKIRRAIQNSFRLAASNPSTWGAYMSSAFSLARSYARFTLQYLGRLHVLGQCLCPGSPAAHRLLHSLGESDVAGGARRQQAPYQLTDRERTSSPNLLRISPSTDQREVRDSVCSALRVVSHQVVHRHRQRPTRRVDRDQRAVALPHRRLRPRVVPRGHQPPVDLVPHIQISVHVSHVVYLLAPSTWGTYRRGRKTPAPKPVRGCFRRSARPALRSSH